MHSSHGQTPTIVIDAMAIITLMIGNNEGEILCGGRHRRYWKIFETFFSYLKSCNVKIVTFMDSAIQKNKKTWLQRRNNEYEADCRLFDKINSKVAMHQLLKEHSDVGALMTARHDFAVICRTFGEVFNATHNDCDAELAYYANKEKAMAVISNDTDFLVFEGDWRLWSARDIDILELKTIEYDRKILQQHLRVSLSCSQLALWATLMGNDHTKSHYMELQSFHRRISKKIMKLKWMSVAKIKELKWLSVAQFVKDGRWCESSFAINDYDIKRLCNEVFGNSNAEMQELIRNGINSYNLNFEPYEETDPLLRLLSNHSSLYKIRTSQLQTLTVSMYDMRRSDMTKIWTEGMAEIIKKCAGVLWMEENRSYSFQLITKLHHCEKYVEQTVDAIYPPENCEYTYGS